MAPTRTRKRVSAATATEIDHQFEIAERHQETLYRSGLVAVAARYDRASRRVMVEMSNGMLLGIPVQSIASLREATQAQLSRVEVDAIGSSLRWDALDADVSVLGIIQTQFGYSRLLRESARAGGSVTSEAKAAAARENGRKGGRPRKQSKR